MHTVTIPHDQRVVNLIPHVSVTNDGYLVVEHSLPNYKLLKSLGHQVNAPVLTGYDWCGLTPYDVQKKTVAMMTTERRGYVLNGLGTGKTMCSLWAFDYLKKSGHANKLLVVAPLSTLHFVWANEIFKRMPHLSYSILHHATKAKRIEALKQDVDVFIINHDGIKTMYDELTARPDIDMVIIDELSAFRNGQSERNKLMRKLTKDREFVFGLTGTPIPRDVTDVWGEAQVVTPHTVPKYYNQFRMELCYRSGPYRWIPKENAVDKAFKTLQPSVRYSLDDVIELPEVVMGLERVQLGPKQAKTYKAMKATATAMVDNGQIDALNAGAVLSKLLQISAGYVYDRTGASYELDNDDRIKKIIELIDEAEKKVLVFVPFKNAINGISKALTRERIEHACVSGDTPVGERKDIFNDFQNTSKYKVILAHPATMSHGLTLTAASVVIWAAPIYDLEVFEQSNGRITRIGQKSKQLIAMIWGSPLERKVYEMLSKKQATQIQLLDLLRDASE